MLPCSICMVQIRTSLSETVYRTQMDNIFGGEHKGHNVQCVSQHDIYQSHLCWRRCPN